MTRQTPRTFRNLLLLAAVLGFASKLLSADQSPGPGTEPNEATRSLIQRALTAAGGEEHLLTLFRMTERFNSGKERTEPGTSRTSIVEPPAHWWVGRKERGKEPGKVAVWAWTLGILRSPESRFEPLPEMTDNEQTLTGLRVSGSVDPPLDLYFDPETLELKRVDWRNDIYRFSDWQPFDGSRYPARCVMYRRKTGEPWFFHEILTIERLKELPEGLERPAPSP